MLDNWDDLNDIHQILEVSFIQKKKQVLEFLEQLVQISIEDFFKNNNV